MYMDGTLINKILLLLLYFSLLSGEMTLRYGACCEVLSAYGWHGKNVDRGGSYWILVDAFAGSDLLPNCLCCSWALQLNVTRSLLPNSK